VQVPGLFDDYVIELIDGGVHDNQGNVSLLEQDCTVILVSDASGQTETETNPSNGSIGVLSRSNNILMARVREAQHRDLIARRKSSRLHALMYVHLKKDLDTKPVDWIGCEDPAEVTSNVSEGHLTSYGISKATQHYLAAIRTDLDSFTEAEAYALMTSGYCMTGVEFPRGVPDFPVASPPAHDWTFLQIESYLRRDVPPERLARVLDVARYRFFKVGRLAMAGLAARVKRKPLLPGDSVVPSGASRPPSGDQKQRRWRYRKSIEQLGIGLGMSSVGWLAARLQLRYLDPKYRRAGEIAALSEE
jgi:hypothetical protein